MDLASFLDEREISFLNNAEKILKEDWEKMEILIHQSCLTGKINSFINSDIMQGSTTMLGLRKDRPKTAGFISVALRDIYIGNCGFALWNDESTETLKNYSTNILSVGAGAGFIESFLEKNGIKIKATDIDPYTTWKKTYLPIKKLSAVKAVKRYPEKDLFICWPSNKELWAYKAVQKLASGKYIFLIADIGCCADEEFYDYLYNSEFIEEVEAVCIPSWYGMFDNLYIFRKK